MPYYDHPDESLPSVAEETLLVRVMPRTRVQKMAEENRLYLPRPWQFEDNFEARLYPAERNSISESEHQSGQSWVANMLIVATDGIASQNAVSCWREYTEEDEILWTAYGGQDFEKQAIFTNVGTLKKAIPLDFNFTIARVNYVDRDNYKYAENRPDLRVFQKDRKDWEWEREIRLVINQTQGGVIPLSPRSTPGLSVPIQFDKLIKMVLDQPEDAQNL